MMSNDDVHVDAIFEAGGCSGRRTSAKSSIGGDEDVDNNYSPHPLTPLQTFNL